MSKLRSLRLAIQAFPYDQENVKVAVITIDELDGILQYIYPEWGIMTKDIKHDLKKLAKETEVMLTESILRWRYKKEGGEIPDKETLKRDSRLITDKANRILYQKGKSILKEIKRAYREGKKWGSSN